MPLCQFSLPLVLPDLQSLTHAHTALPWAMWGILWTWLA